jgi:hypothetical protein
MGCCRWSSVLLISPLGAGPRVGKCALSGGAWRLDARHLSRHRKEQAGLPSGFLVAVPDSERDDDTEERHRAV